MDIVMAFDTGFLLPSITAIYSLFLNNNNVHLHVFYDELSDNAKTVVSKLGKIGSENKIVFFRIESSLLERIKVSTGRWRPETFFRYYTIDILPELDRVLWLDSDVLVRANIEELYNTDFEGRSFAGVIDNSSNAYERIGVTNYINAGVLLINASKLRQTCKMEEYWKLIGSPDYKGELPDQDALNIVFENDIKILETKWNSFPIADNEYADTYIKNACIVHFASQNKPWKPEDTVVFLAVFEFYRSADIFVNEYWDICEKAIEYVGH